MSLSDASAPCDSGPRSDGNKRVLRLLQNTSTKGASQSDCLVSYRGHPLGGGLTTYRDALTAPAD